MIGPTENIELVHEAYRVAAIESCTDDRIFGVSNREIRDHASHRADLDDAAAFCLSYFYKQHEPGNMQDIQQAKGKI